MTTRENVWLLRDVTQQQQYGAVRADRVTELSTMSHDNRELFMVTHADRRSATLGTCRPEYRDRMVEGFLSTLRQADHSDAEFLVIEAIPVDEQDGADAHFWWVHENSWPDSASARQPVPAARVH